MAGIQKEMEPEDLTPEEFEKYVVAALKAEGVDLKDFAVQHLNRVEGTDGDYVFDATATFSALHSSFFVVVECKKHSRPIERSDVQILHQKLRSVGAHKGILFSTSSFQTGAINFAKIHGIALVDVKPASNTSMTTVVWSRSLISKESDDELLLKKYNSVLHTTAEGHPWEIVGCTYANGITQFLCGIIDGSKGSQGNAQHGG